MTMRGTALEGLRVLDLTQYLAGPFCCMLLADMGADVIKVEAPGGGDDMRQADPLLPSGESGAFLAVNRNKRGVVINLKTPEGLEVFKKLVATADILVENMRVGVARRLGIHYEAMREINPRLIYASISGFGQTGPYAHRGGFDLIAQGMSGLMSITGHPGGEPAKCGIPITDLGAGMLCCSGILAALHARTRTGEGQYLDTSLFEAGLLLQVWETAEYWHTGRTPQPTGTAHRLQAPYQAYRARDGYFTVSGASERHWPLFCESIGLPELVHDPRFRTNSDRLRNAKELQQVVERVTVEHHRAHWLARLEERGIAAGPVNTVPEALADPQTAAREMVAEVDHPTAGRVKVLAPAVKMHGTPAGVFRAAPTLGQHTDEILAELGVSPEEIQRLRELGAVG